MSDLKDQDIIRFQRFRVVQSAAAAFTEQAYDTQLSIDRPYIWMIHWVELSMTSQQLESPAQGAVETVSFQCTRETKTAVVSQYDADTILSYVLMKDRVGTIGTEAGPVMFLSSSPLMYRFPIPLCYASQNIFFGIDATHASPQTLNGRVAYTLRKVTDKFFFRVAASLMS